MSFDALWPHYEKRLIEAQLPKIAQDSFRHLFTQFISGNTGFLDWSEIKPLSQNDLVSYHSLTETHAEIGKKALSKLAVLKLNGGLGTTMGCQGAKSAIVIHQNMTFLDLILQQIEAADSEYGISIPLILMNSSATSADSRRILGEKFIELRQHEFPRIEAQTCLPFSCPQDVSQEIYPPGHGDIFIALLTSGVLDQLEAKGIEYLFVSNADNLGPTLNAKLLGHFVKENLDMLMETTPKMSSDKKGGTLIRYKGRLNLLELAQVQEAHLAEFYDSDLFPVFNTNSIWLKISSIRSFLANPNGLDLIVNPKTVQGTKVIQLETAIGSAIRAFDRSATIVVDRERFLPVKKTSDLLIIKSDFIQKNTSLANLQFGSDLGLNRYPDIQLSSHYEKVSQFHERFPHIPSLKQVKKLHINGNIFFGPNVVIKGTVTLASNSERPVKVQNRTFDNEAVLLE